jgi:hypothetical protein
MYFKFFEELLRSKYKKKVIKPWIKKQLTILLKCHYEQRLKTQNYHFLFSSDENVRCIYYF